MAREYAQIRLSIWNDDDFRELTPAAQWLYFMLLTHPTLTSAGVGDWRPNRLAALAGGRDVTVVEEAGAELAQGLYIVVDEETEEYFVRSFHRNDGLLRMPNMATAAARAAAEVASPGIRGVIVHELKRLKMERPEMKGWGSRELLDLMLGDSIDPSAYPCWNPSVEGSGNPSGNPSVDPSGSPSVDPSPTGDRMGSGNPSVNPSPSTATATATHNTQPSTLGGKVVGNVTGGEGQGFSPQDFSAIPDAWVETPGLARCPAHQGDEYPPPCRGCATARETAEAERGRRIAEAKHRGQARRDAIDACNLCDPSGHVVDETGRPVLPAVPCAHDETTNAERVTKVVESEQRRARQDEERRQAAVNALESLGIRRPSAAQKEQANGPF